MLPFTASLAKTTRSSENRKCLRHWFPTLILIFLQARHLETSFKPAINGLDDDASPRLILRFIITFPVSVRGLTAAVPPLHVFKNYTISFLNPLLSIAFITTSFQLQCTNLSFLLPSVLFGCDP